MVHAIRLDTKIGEQEMKNSVCNTCEYSAVCLAHSTIVWSGVCHECGASYVFFSDRNRRLYMKHVCPRAIRLDTKIGFLCSRCWDVLMEDN